MAEPSWLIAVLPLSGLGFALFLYLWLRHESHKLDRRFDQDPGIGK